MVSVGCSAVCLKLLSHQEKNWLNFPQVKAIHSFYRHIFERHHFEMNNLLLELQVRKPASKKNLWVIEWGIIPSILQYSLFYFPLWKGKFPGSIIPRRCPRMVHHMQLENVNIEPYLRNTTHILLPAGSGRVPSPLLARQPRRLQSTGASVPGWAGPGQAGVLQAKAKAWSEHPHGPTGVKAVPF